MILGKSACGKSSVADMIDKYLRYDKLVLCTTRPKRAKEFNGMDYYFIDDSEFKAKIMSNANDLKTFSEHIKNGLAQQIIPEAMKLVYTKGMNFSDAYVSVGLELTQTKQEPKKEERNLSDREKELRKKASESGNNQSNGGKKTLTVDDIANMSDEEFEKLTPEDLE